MLIPGQSTGAGRKGPDFMTPKQFNQLIVLPGSSVMRQMDCPEARVLLMAIAGQESGLSQRLQEPTPVARGYWQCEQSGAVLDVLTSDQTGPMLHSVCTLFDIPSGLDVVFEAIAWHDLLAFSVARMALWLNPAALPGVGDAAAGWNYYVDTWRPGKPRPDAWADAYATALVEATPAAPVPTPQAAIV